MSSKVYVDRVGHDELYRSSSSALFDADSKKSFCRIFESQNIAPFYKGGGTKGYVRGTALRGLLRELGGGGRSGGVPVILDA